MTYEELIKLTHCPICEKEFGPSISKQQRILSCDNDCFAFHDREHFNYSYVYLRWRDRGAIRLEGNNKGNNSVELEIAGYIKYWKEDYRYIAEILTK